jgi:hypothetical protein
MAFLPRNSNGCDALALFVIGLETGWLINKTKKLYP